MIHLMLVRKLTAVTAELIGTACLLLAIVGSGLVGDFLARDMALALFANAVAADQTIFQIAGIAPGVMAVYLVV